MKNFLKSTLALNLEQQVPCARGGKAGLDTLIYGWLRRYGNKYREAVWHRKFLYITEVNELSAYAGVDLTKNEE